MSDPFIGEVRMFAGNFAPLGWAFCSGQLLAISQNDALFALLGTTYGGDGVTTFALPDLRGRVPIHQGTGPGLSNHVIGELGGAETVTLASNQLPTHSHSQPASTDAATPAAGPTGAPASSATTSFYGTATPAINMSPSAVGAAGSGQSHSNMAPFTALSYIIALFGIFPSRN